MRRPAGFTLLELLVVLVIIGVMAMAVSLSVGGRAVDDRMEAESRRLQAMLRLASDEAQAKGFELGFRQVEAGFEFLLPGASAGSWEVVQEGSFRPREVPEPFYLELRVDGRLIRPAISKEQTLSSSREDSVPATENAASKKAEENAPKPQVLILSTGEINPAFTLDLRLKDHKSFYRLEANDLGVIKTERQEDRK